MSEPRNPVYPCTYCGAPEHTRSRCDREAQDEQRYLSEVEEREYAVALSRSDQIEGDLLDERVDGYFDRLNAEMDSRDERERNR